MNEATKIAVAAYKSGAMPHITSGTPTEIQAYRLCEQMWHKYHSRRANRLPAQPSLRMRYLEKIRQAAVGFSEIFPKDFTVTVGHSDRDFLAQIGNRVAITYSGKLGPKALVEKLRLYASESMPRIDKGLVQSLDYIVRHR